MSLSFDAIGLMFVVAGLPWLFGMKFLKRDTELATTRPGPVSSNLKR